MFSESDKLQAQVAKQTKNYQLLPVEMATHGDIQFYSRRFKRVLHTITQE